ncbi:MAG: zinc dependent phospholipase C family protein [Bdellovibrionota bacterium]
MPAEFVHWEILNSVSASAELSSEIRTCLTEHAASAALGAVAHDALYYYRAGTNKACENAASYLHGAFGDDPLKILLEIYRINAASNPAVSAFIFGMATHYAVDSVFHPLIYFLTGDYYADDDKERALARTSHRRFETQLDSWWMDNYSAPKHKISKLLAKTHNQTAEIFNTLEQYLSNTNYPISAETWASSFKHFSLISKLTDSFFLGMILNLAVKLNCNSLMPAEAISKYNRKKALPYFDQEFKYKTPVSGQTATSNLAELRDKAIKSSIKTISALNSQQLDFQGLSMDLGEAGVRTKEAKYFADHLVLLN